MFESDMIDVLELKYPLDTFGARNFAIVPYNKIHTTCDRCREKVIFKYRFEDDIYVCLNCGYHISNIAMSIRMQKFLDENIIENMKQPQKNSLKKFIEYIFK